MLRVTVLSVFMRARSKKPQHEAHAPGRMNRKKSYRDEGGHREAGLLFAGCLPAT
jgi:hypothetical protein